MKAFVIGCLGQDGSFMWDFLKEKGYELFGYHHYNINRLEADILKEGPDEIYNFAGVSNVINPFNEPINLFETNAVLPLKILSWIITYSEKTKFFQASSCLTYGPYYPYGVSKLVADQLIKQYRDKFGIYACSGIFFPHESERRKDHFFSKKIVKAAVNKEKVTVGDLNPYRDYGYAPDYMQAAWLMLQQERPKDYEISTGKLITLKDFVKKVFAEVGLNPKEYITIDKSLSRNEPFIPSNPLPIQTELGWYPEHRLIDMIKIMIENERTVLAR